MAAARYNYAAATTTTLTNAPAGMIVVIDWIMAACEATAGMLTLGSSGGFLAKKSITATDLAGSFFMDFSGGWPVWNVSDAEDTPRTNVTVTLTGTGITNPYIHVGYHWEKESVVRANNIDRRGGV